MRERDKAVDYAISRDGAMLLAGVCQFPSDLRVECLSKYATDHGSAALVELFAAFIGMANSVVQNSHDCIETYAIVGGEMHPHEAEKLNLPTIFGACNGIMIADGINDAGLCDGCAFRIGTIANQSPSTTSDADWCGHPGEQPFMCHMDLDADGLPTKGCAGFAQLRAARKAREAP